MNLLEQDLLQSLQNEGKQDERDRARKAARDVKPKQKRHAEMGLYHQCFEYRINSETERRTCTVSAQPLEG